jgi:hypothetical protein
MFTVYLHWGRKGQRMRGEYKYKLLFTKKTSSFPKINVKAKRINIGYTLRKESKKSCLSYLVPWHHLPLGFRTSNNNRKPMFT